MPLARRPLPHPSLLIANLVAALGCVGLGDSPSDAGPRPMPLADGGSDHPADVSDKDVGSDGGMDGVPMDAPESICTIPCLAMLDTLCRPEGECVEGSLAGSLEHQEFRIYSNEVVACASTIRSAHTGPHGGIRYRTPNGQLCYALTIRFGGGTSPPAYVVRWMDASGREVATAKENPETAKLQVTCPGNPTVFGEQALRSCGAGAAAFQMFGVVKLPPAAPPCTPGNRVDAGTCRSF